MNKQLCFKGEPISCLVAACLEQYPPNDFYVTPLCKHEFKDFWSFLKFSCLNYLQ